MKGGPHEAPCPQEDQPSAAAASYKNPIQWRLSWGCMCKNGSTGHVIKQLLWLNLSS